jgi:hypothetical protein
VAILYALNCLKCGSNDIACDGFDKRRGQYRRFHCPACGKRGTTSFVNNAKSSIGQSKVCDGANVIETLLLKMHTSRKAAQIVGTVLIVAYFVLDSYYDSLPSHWSYYQYFVGYCGSPNKAVIMKVGTIQ